MRKSFILSAVLALPLTLGAAGRVFAKEPVQAAAQPVLQEPARAQELAPAKPANYYETWLSAEAAAKAKNYRGAVEIARIAIRAYEAARKETKNPRRTTAEEYTNAEYVTAFGKSPHDFIHKNVIAAIKNYNELNKKDIKVIDEMERELSGGSSLATEQFNRTSINHKKILIRQGLEEITYVLQLDVQGRSLEAFSATLRQAGVDPVAYYGRDAYRFEATRVIKPLTLAEMAAQKPAALENHR